MQTVDFSVDWALWYFHSVNTEIRAFFIIKEDIESHFKWYGTFKVSSRLLKLGQKELNALNDRDKVMRFFVCFFYHYIDINCKHILWIGR